MDNANVASGKISPLLKRILKVFFGGCFFAFYANMAFFLYLSKHSPDRPDSLTERIFSLNNHGQLFYVRWWESLIAQSSFAPIVAMLVGILLLRWRYGKDALDAMSQEKESRYFSLAVILTIAATSIYMFT